MRLMAKTRLKTGLIPAILPNLTELTTFSPRDGNIHPGVRKLGTIGDLLGFELRTVRDLTPFLLKTVRIPPERTQPQGKTAKTGRKG